jgi:rhodanese-related sulfurtransferase
MRSSFIKIIVILFFAVALALLFNYLQPDGIPLFNENKNKVVSIDEDQNPPPSLNENSQPGMHDTVKQDLKRMEVEKNRVQINEDILPDRDYKNDSALSNNDNIEMPDTGKSSGEDNLSNLTKDVFNQPRLISLSQAYELYKDKILFVDARDPEEYEDGHIAGAINLPLFHIEKYLGNLSSVDKNEPLVAYCEGADCDMSIRLGNELFSKGYRKVFVFLGGWEEWQKANYPVITSNSNLQLN